jgi:hypothetical protein
MHSVCAYIATLSAKYNDRINTSTGKKKFIFIKKGFLDAMDASEQPRKRSGRY